MRKVALDLGKRQTTYCEVSDGEVVQRATVSQVQSLETLLGPERPRAVVAIEACREAWYVHALLVSWENDVVLVDTTRSKRLGGSMVARRTASTRRCWSEHSKRTVCRRPMYCHQSGASCVAFLESVELWSSLELDWWSRYEVWSVSRTGGFRAVLRSISSSACGNKSWNQN